MLSQMQELVGRVHDALPEPWNKGVGRPKSCALYQAVEIACMYLRQNGTQEFLGDLRDISQPTVSRIVSALVPIVQAVLEEFVPDAREAIELVKGRVCLVDGTITPCWSYADHPELWSRKRGTTGFNAQLVGLLDGAAVYISDPLPGKTHDATAFTETPVAEIVRNSGGGIGDKGLPGVRHGHSTENTARWRARQARQGEQRRSLGTASTHRKACRTFQVMADVPHRLSPSLSNL